MYSCICASVLPLPPPKSPNGVLSCCVAWGEEQSGQQVSVQSQIRSTAKAQRNHTYAQCGRYYKQHHRPLQIPITLTIYRSVCKCAKVIWQMWKCRNVHLEGGTGGSCPALQRTNVLWDIWRAKWLHVKLALIQFFSIWCKNSQGLKKLFAFHLPAEEAAMRKMPSSS